jgi:WD40 repeat protein
MNKALVIGINHYAHVRPLQTACGDALAVADLLEARHGYQAQRIVEEGATLAGLRTALGNLRAQLGPDDRVVLYFAGHGIALEADDKPAGYLVPQDAKADDPSTLLPMSELHEALEKLPCRHLLLILDCCFGGTFRWSTSREVRRPPMMFQERYAYFLQEPAWQVLTSAAHDELAVDVIASRPVGQREKGGAHHSPFCEKLLKGLDGGADSTPEDGVITASELYLYLLGPLTGEQGAPRQTPGLWPLPRHRKGEFLFLNPKRQLQLLSAPEISKDNNPYRGLDSYEVNDKKLFFGRDEEVNGLLSQLESSPLVAVVGSSGAGKSSLLKAGVIARLDSSRWEILPVIRPGSAPLKALAEAVQGLAGTSVEWTSGTPDLLSQIVTRWRGEPARSHRKVLFVVDQLEELVTLCPSESQRTLFLDLLARALESGGCALACTARIDFESHFWSGPLQKWWRTGRYLLGPLAQDGLREVIERPAAEQAIFFESPALIERIINEVIAVPGGLPLLSFTLSELYLSFLKAGAPSDRTIREAAYDALGGVSGALWRRANAFYESLQPHEQRTLQWVMLRMVSLEGGRPSRRQLHDDELKFPSSEKERVLSVLERLVQARLVLRRDTFYEPAHDALVLSWWRVQHWLREEQEQFVILRRMTEAAMDKKGTWHDDPRLDFVARRLAEQPERFNSDERAFIRDSVAHKRRLIRRWIGAGAALILTLVGGITATWMQNEKLLESLSASFYSASHEQAEFQNDTPASLLLAARAVERAPSDDPRLPVYQAQALQLLSRAPRAVRNLEFQPGDGAISGTLGQVLLIRDEKGLQLQARDLRGDKLLKVPTLSPDESFSELQPILSRDGQWAALITYQKEQARLRAWKLETGEVTVDTPIQTPTAANVEVGEDFLTRLAFSADGSLLVLKHDLNLRRWEVATAKELEEKDFNTAPVPGALALAQGEGAKNWTVRVIWESEHKNQLEVLDLRTGAPPSPAWKPIHLDGQVFSVAFSPGGQWVAAVFSSCSEPALDYGLLGENLSYRSDASPQEAPEEPAEAPVEAEAPVDPDSCRPSYQLKLWNAATGEPAEWAGSLGDPQPFRLEDISPDGKRLLTTGAYPENAAGHGLRLWLAEQSAYYQVPAPSGTYSEARFGPDERTVLTLSGDRELRLWDAELGRQVRAPERLPVRAVAHTLAEDRREMAFLMPNGLLTRWSLEDERGRDGETTQLEAKEGEKPKVQEPEELRALSGQGNRLDRDATEYAQVEERGRSPDGHFRILSLSDTRLSGEENLCWGPWLLVQDLRTGFVLPGELWLSRPSLESCMEGITTVAITGGQLQVSTEEGKLRSWPLMLPGAGKPSWLTAVAEALTSASMGDDQQPVPLTEKERAARAEAARKALEAETDNPFKPLLLRRLAEASRW